MKSMPLEQTVRNIDKRLGRVEQILPALATKEDLRQAIAQAVAPLASREEMYRAIREEGEQTRRHFDADIATLDRRVMRLEVSL